MRKELVCSRRKSALWLLSPLLALGLAAGVRADDPKTEIDSACEAPDVVLAAYEVQPTKEVEFVNAMVGAGPFHGQATAFVNETIGQAISDIKAGEGARFFSVTSYQNTYAPFKVQKARDTKVASTLKREPEYIQAKVMEHLIANWGWTRGTAVSFKRVVPTSHEGDPFTRYDTTLAFFKTGYTGQMSMLESFKPGTRIEAVREDLTKRRGMTGASIYLDESTGNFYAYSEYFNLADSDLTSANLADRRVAMVVQNYTSR